MPVSQINASVGDYRRPQEANGPLDRNLCDYIESPRLQFKSNPLDFLDILGQ